MHPLIPALLQAIQKMGYQKPTAIQTATIHPILQGHDLIATAPTGTGKTAAFAPSNASAHHQLESPP